MFHIGFLSKASDLSAASVKLRKSLSWTPLRLFGVELEKQGDAVGVCCRRLQSICLVDKRVEVRVGFHEIGRHRERIVEVCQRRAWVRGARVKLLYTIVLE